MRMFLKECSNLIETSLFTSGCLKDISKSGTEELFTYFLKKFLLVWTTHFYSFDNVLTLDKWWKLIQIEARCDLENVQKTLFCI